MENKSNYLQRVTSEKEANATTEPQKGSVSIMYFRRQSL